MAAKVAGLPNDGRRDTSSRKSRCVPLRVSRQTTRLAPVSPPPRMRFIRTSPGWSITLTPPGTAGVPTPDSTTSNSECDADAVELPGNESLSPPATCSGIPDGNVEGGRATLIGVRPLESSAPGTTPRQALPASTGETGSGNSPSKSTVITAANDSHCAEVLAESLVDDSGSHSGRHDMGNPFVSQDDQPSSPYTPTIDVSRAALGTEELQVRMVMLVQPHRPRIAIAGAQKLDPKTNSVPVLYRRPNAWQEKDGGWEVRHVLGTPRVRPLTKLQVRDAIVALLDTGAVQTSILLTEYNPTHSNPSQASHRRGPTQLPAKVLLQHTAKTLVSLAGFRWQITLLRREPPRPPRTTLAASRSPLRIRSTIRILATRVGVTWRTWGSSLK